MQLTSEHKILAESARRFVQQEIDPYVEQWEAERIFPARELFRKLGALGLLGVTKPEQVGGLGLDYSYAAVVHQELGRCLSGGVPMAIGVQTDMATPALARFGSDEVRQRFLAPAVSGEMVACIGVSEPDAGSDVAAIRTRAVRDGDDYVISGSKMWITNGTQADWMCMLAVTGGDHRHRNKSLICVPLRDEDGSRYPGVSLTSKIEKIGMHCSDTALLSFDAVRVPVRWRIGEEGEGFIYQMQQFQEERLFAALSTIGALEQALAETEDYVRERRIFGAPVLDNQVVHYRLAELHTELAGLKALTWQGVESVVAGEDATPLASMAKLSSARLARTLIDSCLQYWGGMGYSSESAISRRYRDSRLWSIGGGADEVMLGIICKHLDLMPGGTEGDRR